MINAKVKGPPLAAFRDFQRFAEQRFERAALIATDRASREALRQTRDGMRGAGLGRLPNAIGQTSDLKKGRGVFRRGAGVSASGVVFIKTRNERTVGAIQSYTEGSTILPVRGRWLWIATDDIPARAGRFRMTPERYRQFGFEQKIGPLFVIRSVNGYPLLVTEQVGINAAGKARSARSLKKNGQPRKGDRVKTLLVAFIGIPRTSRRARIDVNAILREEQQRLPSYFYDALGEI